jgi:hypothetical protein
MLDIGKPILHDFSMVVPQSGTVEDSTVPEMEAVQNLQMVNQVEDFATTIDDYVDITRKTQDDDTAPLGDFLSRPVRIAQFDWGTGTAVNETFNPWTLFFENKRVINRIANFNLLRAKLHMRFLINGNAFQYGRVMVYYRPLAPLNEIDTDAGLVPQDIVQGSQCPRIFLDPTTSQGGEIELPFFWHKNYLNVPRADWRQMGLTFVRTLNTLKHANGASDSVTITVLAWATEVELSVLTNTPPAGIVPQMGEFEQVNQKGLISGPATTISKIAGSLSSIPWLKPYALASEMVASTVATAARAFGYSRPTVTACPELFAARPIGSLALTNVGDNSQKLTVDAYQETTIDPRVSGVGAQDEMCILDIAKRESYLTSFNWSIGTPVDTLLWNTSVQPSLWAESGIISLHLPAVAAASLPFQYWTGTLKFRFQVVCSAFHKGRLRLAWDPSGETDVEFNTNHQMLVDIADEKDFTIEISNGQEYTLLEKLPIQAGFQDVAYGSGPVFAGGNGVLYVRVLNQLTVPNTEVNNDIQINVYVSAGDDFEVFVPSGEMGNYTFSPQAGRFPTVEESTTQPSKPTHSKTMSLFNHKETPQLNKVFTGEAITSFRPLLKRFTHHHSVLYDPTPGTNLQILHRFSGFPYFRGGVPGAVDNAVGGAPTNYCNTTLLNYLMPAYAGWKGSTRWKAIPNNTNINVFLSYFTRSFADDSFIFDRLSAAADAFTSLDARLWANLQTNEMSGSDDRNATPRGDLGTAIATHVNIVNEVELPWYSRYRFIPTKTLNYTTNSSVLIRPITAIYRGLMNINGQSGSRGIDFHVAAGDDFQFYFWTGMPRIYFVGDFPLPQP